MGAAQPCLGINCLLKTRSPASTVKHWDSESPCDGAETASSHLGSVTAVTHIKSHRGTTDEGSPVPSFSSHCEKVSSDKLRTTLQTKKERNFLVLVKEGMNFNGTKALNSPPLLLLHLCPHPAPPQKEPSKNQTKSRANEIRWMNTQMVQNFLDWWNKGTKGHKISKIKRILNIFLLPELYKVRSNSILLVDEKFPCYT